MSAAQGQGNSNAGSWSSWSSSSQSGQPNGNNQYSCDYSGIDANGRPYGGHVGNGAFCVNITDDQGLQHTYNGGQTANDSEAGGHSSQPNYTGTHIYTSSNTNQNGQSGSSQSSYVWIKY